MDSCFLYIKTNYKIDPNEIILQGFSLGDRSALKYGLDNPTKFKGLLLNTPAIQGLHDSYNTLPGKPNFYNYSNAKKIPIYIMCGQNDYVYVTTIAKSLELLKKNDAKVQYEIIPNMQHNIPSEKYITKGLGFINQPLTEDNKAELFLLDLPMQHCSGNISPQLYIRNIGKNKIKNIIILFYLNGIESNIELQSSIKPFDHLKIDLNNKNLTDGFQTLTYKILSLTVIL